MSEVETTPGEVQQKISYHFEAPHPLDRDGKFIAIGLGGVAGFLAGALTDLKVDHSAIHYENLLNDAEGDLSPKAPQRVHYLESHPVHHIKQGEAAAIIACEVGLGAVLAVPFVTAALWASFKLKMKRSRAIADKANQWLDLDQHIRGLKLPDQD